MDWKLRKLVETCNKNIDNTKNCSFCKISGLILQTWIRYDPNSSSNELEIAFSFPLVDLWTHPWALVRFDVTPPSVVSCETFKMIKILWNFHYFLIFPGVMNPNLIFVSKICSWHILEWISVLLKNILILHTYQMRVGLCERLLVFPSL